MTHITKQNYVFKSCIGRPYWDMNLIGLRVISLSLIGYVVISFNEIPYNSIYTWDQLTDAFLVRLFPMSKNLNKKDKLNSFAAQPGESVSSFWDRHPVFMRCVLNHRINDESLKEYFYRGRI